MDGARPGPNRVRLGIPASETALGQQSDFFKELVNKMAWVLGTSYRCSYQRLDTESRLTALALANRVLSAHGYGAHLAK